jgi:REP element-mobilizing transposase RayT
MVRKPRVVVEGGLYHVYNRFARGARIFDEGDEGERFLGLLRQVRDRDGLTVFAYCLMGDHFHVALRTGPVPLSRSIGFVQFRFAQDYNRRHRSSGPLWQSRFKAKVVDDEGYLLQLVAYIHLNPVTAKVVADPAEYPRSGHRELLGRTPTPLVDAEQTLSLYGATLRSARRSYVRTLERVDAETWRASLPGGLPWWPSERDRPVDPPPPAAWIDESGLSTGRDRPLMSAAEFLERCAGLLGIAVGRLAVRQRDAETCRLRYLVAGVGIERWRQQPAALAKCAGRWPEAVGRWARRAGQLRLTDEGFSAAYESLDERLAAELKE